MFPAPAATTPAAPAEGAAVVPTAAGESVYSPMIPRDDRLATPGALDLQTAVSRSSSKHLLTLLAENPAPEAQPAENPPAAAEAATAAEVPAVTAATIPDAAIPATETKPAVPSKE